MTLAQTTTALARSVVAKISRISPTRVLLLTIALVVTGAVCGAPLGALVAVLQATPHRIPGLSFLRYYFFAARVGAEFGAVLGAVFSPLVGWAFLRRIPIGRAIGVTWLGVLAGIIVGFFVPPGRCAEYGMYGFFVSAGGLWISTLVPRVTRFLRASRTDTPAPGLPPSRTPAER